MDNPYNIKDDIRAYYGYEQCRVDILTIISSLITKDEDETNEVLIKLLEVIDVQHIRG